jgi:hypothetical protein
MSTPSTKPPSTEEHVADLCVVMEKMASAVATIQGNQGQLTIAINRLQSEKLVATLGDQTEPNASKKGSATDADTIVHASNHGRKLMFPTYDGLDDPLPWLNHCDQFFRVQETPVTGKVFLATFYMIGEASQWYTVLERNQWTPS